MEITIYVRRFHPYIIGGDITGANFVGRSTSGKLLLSYVVEVETTSHFYESELLVGVGCINKNILIGSVVFSTTAGIKFYRVLSYKQYASSGILSFDGVNLTCLNGWYRNFLYESKFNLRTVVADRPGRVPESQFRGSAIHIPSAAITLSHPDFSVGVLTDGPFTSGGSLGRNRVVVRINRGVVIDNLVFTHCIIVKVETSDGIAR